MKIINIHGYKGSAENAAYTALKSLGHEVISEQIDYNNNTIDLYNYIIDEYIENKADMIVGTSLGGFFALAVAVKNNFPCVLVNPCLCPFITLSKLGYTGDIKGYMELFGAFAETDSHQDNITAIIGGQDEIIDYHDFTRKIIRNNIVVPEGKHSGATMPLRELFKECIK